MKIVFIRHTQSEGNKKQIYGGQIDYELTSLGEKQMEYVTNLLEDFKILSEVSNKTKVYTSPLTRCKKLAKKISKNKGFKLVEVEYLREYNFGIFEGKSHKELEKKVEYKNWVKDYINYKIPNGESLIECQNRVEKFLEELCEENEDSIVVAHEGIIKISILYLLDIPLEKFWSFYNGNSSIVEIEYKQGFAYLKNLINV